MTDFVLQGHIFIVFSINTVSLKVTQTLLILVVSEYEYIW